MTSGAPDASPAYRLWPRYRPGSVELGGAGLRPLLRMGTALAIIALVLALPPVVALTGLPARWALGLMAAYFLCMVGNDFVLHPLAMRSRAGFNLQMALLPLYNVAFCAAFVVVPGDPKSPLWMALLLFATSTGNWQEIDRSLALLAVNVLAPLATIPFFLARGAPAGWSIAAPVLCAVVSGLTYHGLSMTSWTGRRLRQTQAAAIADLQARAAELERRELARDLHDAVGSQLAVVALYGEVIERHLDRPDELRAVAQTLRDTAQEGIDQLRGVLGALAPGDGTAGSLTRSLEALARRIPAAAGIHVQVVAEGDAALVLEGRARLALVRVFQEALNNAVRHGRAARVEARLHVEAGAVSLTVRDDGRGFAADRPASGRGLPGMAARAGELGDTFQIRSAPGAGTELRVVLPRAGRAAA
jgi:signal transduction histidine kinase